MESHAFATFQPTKKRSSSNFKSIKELSQESRASSQEGRKKKRKRDTNSSDECDTSSTSKQSTTKTRSKERNSVVESQPKNLQIVSSKQLVSESKFGVDEENYIQAPYDAAPLEWGIKTKLRFTSVKSFQWCTTLQTKDESDGLKHFFVNTFQHSHTMQPTALFGTPQSNSEKPKSTSSLLPPSPPAAFYSACLYWMYPSEVLSNDHPVLQTALNASSKSAEDLTPIDVLCKHLIRDRWNEWQQAFTSLYYRFRQGEVDHFYLRSTSYVVLFLSPRSEDVNNKRPQSRTSLEYEHRSKTRSRTNSKKEKTDRTEPQAIVTRSHKGFRTTLSQKGVRFTMPLSKGDLIPKINADILQDLKFLEETNPNSTRILSDRREFAQDQSLASLLLISGRQDVHSLYDVLLNWPVREDVPLLYCNSAFTGATLKALQVSKNIAFQTSVSPSSTTSNLHAVHFTGWILPSTVIKLCNIFKETQGDFELMCWNESQCSSANINALSLSHLDALHGQECCAISLQREVYAALTNASIADQGKTVARSVKRMKCISGKFFVVVES